MTIIYACYCPTVNHQQIGSMLCLSKITIIDWSPGSQKW